MRIVWIIEVIKERWKTIEIRLLDEKFTAQGWHPDIAGYLSRLKDRSENKCIALTAVYERCPAGYVYVYMCANEGPFKDKGWPIIVDFNVLKKYQRRGIGNRLMDAAEQVASQYADNVCLGVGLCDSYGAAQRMYVKRGYIPDGSGVWYQDKQCVQYKTVCTIDDDLILFFFKETARLINMAVYSDKPTNPVKSSFSDILRFPSYYQACADSSFFLVISLKVSGQIVKRL